MAKFYVKITKEAPLSDDDSIWFELDTDSEEESEFFVVDKNGYNSLIAEFNTIKEHFEEEYVQPIVEREVTEYMSSLDSVDKSKKIVDSNDENYYTYDSLNETINNKLDIANIDNSLNSNSTNPVQNKVLTDIINTKANNSTVSSLQTTLNTKANSSHNHSTWTYLKVNDYGALYYNANLRIAVFGYYRADVNFSSNTTVQVATIPSAYRPRWGFEISTHNPNMVADVGTDGKVNVYHGTKAKHNVNLSGMWIY